MSRMAKKRKQEANPTADRSELRRLLEAAKADYHDDGPRLALADWLEEHGGEADQARAEVVRLQLDTANGGPDWAVSVEQRREKWAHEWAGAHRLFFRTRQPECERGLLVAAVRAVTWRGAVGPPDEAWAWVESARPVSFAAPELKAMFGSPLLASVPRLDLSTANLRLDGVRLLPTHLPTTVRAIRVATSEPDLGLLGQGLHAGIEELGVEACGSEVPNAGPLLALSVAAGLRALSLRQCSVDDEGAALLAGMAGLRRLELVDVTLTDASVTALAGLPLRRLALKGGNFGIRALPLLAGSPCRDTLEELRLAGGVKPRPLRGRSALPRLRRLAMTGGWVDAGAVTNLAEAGLLAGLAELDLSGNSIRAKGAEALAALSAGPRALRLVRCSLGNKGAAHLAAWPGLANVRLLDLSGNGLSGAGVRALVASGHVPALEALALNDNPGVKADAVLDLLRSPLGGRLAWLALDGLEMNAALAGAFMTAAPPLLRELKLGRYAFGLIGAEGMSRLQAALPGCAIG
jgi:uncharacterized protein (TIGR02996 family)